MSWPHERRREDPFSPPREPIAVFCLHCGEEFESWQMIWRPRVDGDNPSTDDAGDWCCPTDGCCGVGFGFDILPCDEEWCDEHGHQWYFSDDADEDDFDFDGVVDDAVIDQFWREDPTSLTPESVPDELLIDTEGLDEHPLTRLLPPEELPANFGFREDDVPF